MFKFTSGALNRGEVGSVSVLAFPERAPVVLDGALVFAFAERRVGWERFLRFKQFNKTLRRQLLDQGFFDERIQFLSGW